MNQKLRTDAEAIVRAAIEAVKPDEAVRRLLSDHMPRGRIYLVAVGKAAWRMAKTACELTDVEDGVVITKYDHVEHSLPGLRCFEAGHPVPDENSVLATQAALEMTEHLSEDDTVLFLLSGGGSALFERPRVSLAELQDITSQLLACGAEITEINTIRKRLSAVKGGRFAQWCAPARVMTVLLSDVLGDRLDMIASGPAAPDGSTTADALAIAEKYSMHLRPETKELLTKETPKALHNVTSHIIGSVRELVRAAEQKCRELGYEPVFLTDRLCCEARAAGSFLGSILESHACSGRKLAFLAGGETVVRLTGSGLGGRNQEIALAAAERIAGISNAAVISVGSDGTDGPTDAAGGYADGDTLPELRKLGMTPEEILRRNDAYHGLKAVDGLIITGPTGTNVNDIAVALLG